MPPIRVIGSAIVALAFLGGAPAGQEPPAPAASADEPARNIDEYNLPKSRLALKGYDPVAYFPEGGSEPKKGKGSIVLEHKGVTYRFATEANREAFRADPGKYEPAYGGWCAWAMADGDRADINPKSFLIQDGRLLVFYDGFFGDTRAKWLKGDQGALAGRADAAWKDQSGESPRMPAPPE